MDALELVLMEEQAVQVDQAAEGVLVEAPEFVPVQEKVAEVNQVHKEVFVKVVNVVVLQVEVLQVVEATEYPVGQRAEAALVQVQGM